MTYKKLNPEEMRANFCRIKLTETSALLLSFERLDICLEIQRNPIVSTMNHAAIGLRRRLRSILDFETIHIMIFRKMVC